MRNLTPRQARFVDEYLVDLNATQAAARAGYSDPGKGRQLVTKSNVAAAIAARIQARQARTEVTQDNVIRELARIAFGDRRDLMEWGPDGVRLIPSDQLTADQAAQVAEVSETVTLAGGSIKLKAHDKVKALELLGRYLGMFAIDNLQRNPVASFDPDKFFADLFSRPDDPAKPLTGNTP